MHKIIKFEKQSIKKILKEFRILIVKLLKTSQRLAETHLSKKSLILPVKEIAFRQHRFLEVIHRRLYVAVEIDLNEQRAEREHQHRILNSPQKTLDAALRIVFAKDFEIEFGCCGEVGGVTAAFIKHAWIFC